MLKGTVRAVVAVLLVAMGVVAPAARPAAAAVPNGTNTFGVTGRGELVLFNAADPGGPGELFGLALSGIPAGSTLEAIDFRPRTGQLYGLAVAANNTDATVLRIDPSGGVATQVGSTITFEAGTQWGFDFNPTVDRIRVTNENGENARINPNTGARADAPTNDTNISGGTVTGVAYDRSYDTGLAVANRTTAYAIDVAGDTLATIGGVNQSPSPNGGVVTAVGPLGVDATGDAGFAISPDGLALAALTVGGTNALYEVNLASGQVTLVGALGNGSQGLQSLAIVPATTVFTGAGPTVRAHDRFTLEATAQTNPYGAGWLGDIRVAAGDVNLDGEPELVTGPGPGGGPNVQVRSAAGRLDSSFFAYDPAFRGGVFVAAGDVNGDGFKDIITGAGAGGGPHVKVFSGVNGAVLASFFAYDPAFRGGVAVAAADIDLDGDAEIITAPGAGGGPHVRVFDGLGNPFTSASLPSFANSFFAYPPAFTGGVTVAAGDLNGDGTPEVITGPGAGGGPNVRTFNGRDGSLLTSFIAYEPSFTGGVRVGLADVRPDGRYEVATTSGPGRPTELRAFTAVGSFVDSSLLGGRAGAFTGGVRR